MQNRLIVALDVPTPLQAAGLVDRLGDSVSFYKIGYQLAYAGGLGLIADLKAAGKSVFVDLKLLDIDNTVARGVESLVKTGADMLTVHAYPRTMEAAVSAAQGSSTCLLGVCVLTSMDDTDLSAAGYHDDATTLVMKRARQAEQAGMGGIVCSAQEAEAVRDIIGADMAVVTPGIRPAGAAVGDQKRIMSPAEALAAGATHLVVGRPITQAADPVQAAKAIVHDMQQAQPLTGDR